MFSISSSNAILGINNSNTQIDKFLTQIQTGNRINKAADDASGMSIANSLRSQHLGLAQGTQNANNAVSLLNIADNALGTYKETLDTIRTKAIQASSEAESGESRQALQKDINALMNSIKQIVSNTAYNGINLLNGQFNNKSFQVGAYANQTVGVTIQDSSIEKMGHFNKLVGAAVSAGSSAATLKINGTTISVATVSATTKDGANLMVDAINAQSNTTGVKASAETTVTGGAVVGGAIADNDILINGVSIGNVTADASDTSGNLMNAINNISNETGVTASIVAGKLELHSEDGNNIHITEANSGAAKAGLTVGTNYGKVTMTAKNSITVENATAVSGLNSTTATAQTLKDLDVTTYQGAQDAIAILGNAVSELDSIRGSVGSATNQLERVISVNDVTEKNIKAAESTIRGADLVKAKEELDTWTIKNQAAMFAFSMSAQTQQSILSILR